MLNSNYQGNANQKSRRKEVMSVTGKHLEKNKSLHIVGRKISWFSHYEGQYRDSSKKKKNRTTIQYSNPTSGYIFKGNENRLLRTYIHFHDLFSINQDVETACISQQMSE